MYKIKKLLSLTSCLLLWSIGHSQAQDFIQLKGFVVEENTNISVPYATVRLKGFALGTITSLGGHFSFWLSKKYENQTIVISSVGYVSKEISISDLKKGSDNQIVMKVDIRELADVTVISEKRLKALEILKRAINKIPINYQNSQHTFDAYYSETIAENGVVIKYADAAVTFDQSPYEIQRYGRGPIGKFSSLKSGIRFGPWLRGYSGVGRISERLHDHFLHETSEKDKVKINESRTSLNHTRENFLANSEGGPLGSLSKDLVKYIAHFMDKKNFGKYDYELAEIPTPNGDWDYVVSFKPKRAPKKVEDGSYKIGGLGNRPDILTGEVYIDQNSYVIKKMNYKVAPEYRGHICSLGLMEVVHYGYKVDVDYMEHKGRWQMKKINRLDEFIYQDTVTQKTTPYSAISEIFVTNPNSDLKSVSSTENFANLNYNSIQDYHTPYNQEFWDQYTQDVPMAQLDDSLRKYMEEKMPLEQQFALSQSRNKSISPPKTPIKPQRVVQFGTSSEDNYHWLNEENFTNKTDDVIGYLNKEKVYADNYFLPLTKVYYGLMGELLDRESQFVNLKPIEGNEPLNWAQFKRSSKNKLYHTRIVRIESTKGTTIPVSFLFMGKNKDKWLKERPILITIKGKDKLGARMEFDPLLIPMLNRGMIFAYVHLEGGDELSPTWYTEAKLKRKNNPSYELVEAVKYLKENGLCHVDKVFVNGMGIGAGIIASAINENPDLFAAAFLDFAQLDIIGALHDSRDSLIRVKMNGLSNRKRKDLSEYINQHSPYQNIKVQSYPKMAFFTEAGNSNYWQSAKMLAKLRASKIDNNTLLLKARQPISTGSKGEKTRNHEVAAFKYALLFQWLDDIQKGSKGTKLLEQN